MYCCYYFNRRRRLSHPDTHTHTWELDTVDGGGPLITTSTCCGGGAVCGGGGGGKDTIVVVSVLSPVIMLPPAPWGLVSAFSPFRSSSLAVLACVCIALVSQ
jgi:hypothetical protein